MSIGWYCPRSLSLGLPRVRYVVELPRMEFLSGQSAVTRFHNFEARQVLLFQCSLLSVAAIVCICLLNLCIGDIVGKRGYMRFRFLKILFFVFSTTSIWLFTPPCNPRISMLLV